MSLEKLTESSCVACREDAPLVTQEEIEELKPQIPAWEIQKTNGIDRLICAFSVSYTHLTLPTNSLV